MKLNKFLLVGASSLVLFACGNEETPDEMGSISESDTEEVVAEETENKEVESSGEELTLDSFGEALEEAGFSYEPVDKEPAFIGATAGQGYDVNGDVVELYKYVDGSELFEEIKNKGFIEIEDVIAFEVETNGSYALAANEHPNADEIIGIFNSFDGSK